MIEDNENGVCDICGKENIYVQRLLNEIRWKDNTYQVDMNIQRFYYKELWVCQGCRNNQDKIKKKFFEVFKSEI